MRSIDWSSDVWSSDLEFEGDDKIAVIYRNGTSELHSFDLSTHFGEGIAIIEKFDPARVYTAVHLDKKSGQYYVKRFHLDDIATGRKVSIISEGNGSKLILLSHAPTPLAEVRSEEHTSELQSLMRLSYAV